MTNKTARYLITTADERTWEFDRPVIFLGEWCKLYDRKSVWSQIDSMVMPVHWEDRSKLKRDHDYLKEFYEKVLTALSNTLNNLHGVGYSTEYWRIILGPWLLTYVAVVWDRWESVRIVFSLYELNKTKKIDCSNLDLVPENYTEAIAMFQNQLWNHLLFSDIISSQYSQKIFIENTPCASEYLTKEKTSLKKKSLKMYVIHLIDRIFGKIERNYKVVFLNSYFSFWNQIRLSLSLWQLPRMHSEFNEAVEMPCICNSQRKSFITFEINNSFEEFVRKNILSHIPIAHLEGYTHIKEKSNQKFPNCNTIFTANSHWGNELFKLWCAEKVARNAKLIISEHGGALRSHMTSFNHEEKISQIRTVWHDESEPGHIKLPPNKIMGMDIDVNPNAQNIVIIGLETPLFSYRCQSGPGSSLILKDYEQKIDFARKLDHSVYANLLVRPYPDRGWNLYKRYEDDLGKEKMAQPSTLRGQIANSKMIVCTYPLTTFSEAMHSGVPTILLYKENFWEIDPHFNDVVNILKSAFIVFSCPYAAAKHVNAVWKDPAEWWTRNETVEAREYFFNKCGRAGKESLNEWSVFFKKEGCNSH
jgi:putative transferase (TIGR04331 family)